MSRHGTPDTLPEAAGYLGLLRCYPALRALWLGRVISLTGDWFNLIALYEAIQGLSTSARAITLVLVAKTLPVFLLTPLVGPLVDRFDRRILLILPDGFRVLCAVGLIISYHLGSMAGLYACTVLMICGTAVTVPATNAALPMLVPAVRVPAANALLGGTWPISLAGGAALGGLFTAMFGVSASLAMDGLTFVISGLLMMRLPHLPAPARAPGTGAERAGFIDGVAYLVRHPYILCLTNLKPFMQIYAGGLYALIPLYGSGVFAGAAGPFYVGVLYAMRGLGALVGSMVVRSLFGDTVPIMRRFILVGFMVGTAGFAALTLCTRFWHAGMALFAAALGQSMVWVFSGSLLQVESEPRYHGRIFSIEFGLATMVIAVSSYTSGAVIDHGVAIDRVAMMFSALGLLPLCLWSLVLWRRRRRD